MPSFSVQSPVSAPPAYISVLFPPEDDFTLQELVPPSISVPPPVSSQPVATSYVEAPIYLPGPSTASLSLEEEVFPSTSCDVTIPEPPRASKKRRRALSPTVTQDTEPPSTRVRIEIIESREEAMAALRTVSFCSVERVLRTTMASSVLSIVPVLTLVLGGSVS